MVPCMIDVRLRSFLAPPSEASDSSSNLLSYSGQFSQPKFNHDLDTHDRNALI